MCLMSYARSLISAFVVRCLDSIISLDSIAEISSLQLASVAAQAGLCLTLSETAEDTFSHGVAHVIVSVQVGSETSEYSLPKSFAKKCSGGGRVQDSWLFSVLVHPSILGYGWARAWTQMIRWWHYHSVTTYRPIAKTIFPIYCGGQFRL